MSARTLMLGATVALFAVAAQASPSGAHSSGQAAKWSQSGRDYAFVLLNPGDHGVAMSGSSADVRRARSLRAGGEPLLYVRQGGAAYVIRDAATLRKAKSLFEPQAALGRQQAELGSRQAALGREQARLGARQASLAYRQVDASPGQAAAVAREQAALSREQALLGQQQAALGRQQGELGRQQGELGRAADKEMRRLVDEAVRLGLAQRVE